MSADLFRELELLEKEKGINKDIIIEAIEAALISAYKKNFGSSQNVRVNFDKETGEFKVFTLKKVVEAPQNDLLEISLDQAKQLDAQLEIDDVAEIEVTPRSFGRISAQTAKQVVVQRLRDAERGMIFEEFSNKEGEIVSGIIQRVERKNVYIAFEKTEGVLSASEQTAGERYNFNDRMKTYVIDVKKTTKGPQILLSRTHPGLVKRLFELEVPEIQEGVVEIKSLTREAGSRTKIAVYSKDENIDPVGACVGQKGTRVQAIVDELRGEKIDIMRGKK
jgi:N utilization substance protein A